MSKRDELIKKYAVELKEKLGEDTDLDLLTKVTIGLGPSIYNADSATISGSDQSELRTVKNNFLIKKLGLKESPELDTAINNVIEKYGKSNRNKYRAVVYYLLTKHFKKEEVYIKRGTGPR
ncbi:DUF2853 family protein [Winogradskyella litoriviva]|uniref:DUF2853 family protein n=1 Tax=Winogradskyella litoriviva TaxID=1220182 RepID=A0ABX2E9W3_9FLAO|nr:DUF2853 family protein [Winogradskyella litoriviva]NRD24878.1 DUF2853 family protein [Winogradskyella litoriviva]